MKYAPAIATTSTIAILSVSLLYFKSFNSEECLRDRYLTDYQLIDKIKSYIDFYTSTEEEKKFLMSNSFFVEKIKHEIHFNDNGANYEKNGWFVSREDKEYPYRRTVYFDLHLSNGPDFELECEMICGKIAPDCKTIGRATLNKN